MKTTRKQQQQQQKTYWRYQGCPVTDPYSLSNTFIITNILQLQTYYLLIYIYFFNQISIGCLRFVCSGIQVNRAISLSLSLCLSVCLSCCLHVYVLYLFERIAVLFLLFFCFCFLCHIAHSFVAWSYIAAVSSLFVASFLSVPVLRSVIVNRSPRHYFMPRAFRYFFCGVLWT